MKYILLELVNLAIQSLNKRPVLRNGLALISVLLTLQLGWGVLSWVLFSDRAANGRRAIYGAVMIDSTPLDNAIISFRPLNGEPFNAGGNVLSGKFYIPQRSGLVPGKYVVRINASIHDPAMPAPPAGERDTRPGVEILPARYNSASELNVNVGGLGKTYFEFQLQSK